MILDTLTNTSRYLSLHPGFAPAFEFLRRTDIQELPVGKYTIDGERIFALIAKGQGRRKGEAELEAHEQYVDIQYVLAGTDEMGWKPRSACQQVTRAYDAKTDIGFFADQPDSWFLVNSGALAIFFPEDAHLPLIGEGIIHKVVVKVAVI